MSLNFKDNRKVINRIKFCSLAQHIRQHTHLYPSPLAERNRITEEISLLKNLKHKNVITFINAWINKNKNEIVFITECLSGGSLKK